MAKQTITSGIGVLWSATVTKLNAMFDELYQIFSGKSGGQTIIGGTGATDKLTLQGTSGTGSETANAISLVGGDNGDTEGLSLLNNGNVVIGENAYNETGFKVLTLDGGIDDTMIRMNDLSALYTYNNNTYFNTLGANKLSLGVGGWSGLSLSGDGVSNPSLGLRCAPSDMYDVKLSGEVVFDSTISGDLGLALRVTVDNGGNTLKLRNKNTTGAAPAAAVTFRDNSSSNSGEGIETMAFGYYNPIDSTAFSESNFLEFSNDPENQTTQSPKRFRVIQSGYFNATYTYDNYIREEYSADGTIEYYTLGGDTILSMTPITGLVGIGTSSPTSALQVVGLPVYANNAAAVAGGLTAGAFYRTGADPDPVCVVH